MAFGFFAILTALALGVPSLTAGLEICNLQMRVKVCATSNCLAGGTPISSEVKVQEGDMLFLVNFWVDTWSFCPDTDCQVNAVGSSQLNPFCKVVGCKPHDPIDISGVTSDGPIPIGSLVAKIDNVPDAGEGLWFNTPSCCDFQPVKQNGTLYLGFWDDDCSDNSGCIYPVVVKVYECESPAPGPQSEDLYNGIEEVGKDIDDVRGWLPQSPYGFQIERELLLPLRNASQFLPFVA